MELLSDYRVLDNDCQHFAKALIRDITAQDLSPRTIAEVMLPFIEFVDNAKNIARLRAQSQFDVRKVLGGNLATQKLTVIRSFKCPYAPTPFHRHDNRGGGVAKRHQWQRRGGQQHSSCWEDR
jgi:hypothetical protein